MGTDETRFTGAIEGKRFMDHNHSDDLDGNGNERCQYNNKTYEQK
jgi:hypothetical protein